MRLIPLILLSVPLLASDTPWPTAGWTTSSPEEQGMDSARIELAS